MGPPGWLSQENARLLISGLSSSQAGCGDYLKSINKNFKKGEGKTLAGTKLELPVIINYKDWYHTHFIKVWVLLEALRVSVLPQDRPMTVGYSLNLSHPQFPQL